MAASITLSRLVSYTVTTASLFLPKNPTFQTLFSLAPHPPPPQATQKAVQTTMVSELTKGKKAVLFAVPDAFTPTCSQKHVSGFVEKSGELRAKGIDIITCISVNDEVLLLSDSNGTFTKAIGVELDLRDKPIGLGVRSRRYALLADDGLVKLFNLEEGGAFTFSDAQDIL